MVIRGAIFVPRREAVADGSLVSFLGHRLSLALRPFEDGVRLGYLFSQRRNRNRESCWVGLGIVQSWSTNRNRDRESVSWWAPCPFHIVNRVVLLALHQE